jgi:hypothetical protein
VVTIEKLIFVNVSNTARNVMTEERNCVYENAADMKKMSALDDLNIDG